MEAFQNRFGHAIIERYGMTEALMIMTNPYDGERRPGTVGSPFPGVDVMLSADASGEGAAASAGADQVEGAGDVGEVWVRSRHLFSGYWRNEEATRAAFSNGWFRSGDLAVRSSDGYYTLRGRKGDVIISGGFNVYPREIEELLLEDAGIREAAVIGVPHDLYGEVPVAYVVTDEALDAALLDSRCRAQLAAFKVPRSFVRVDSLPRNAMGKVQKHLLPAL
jgi:malonyl-CoA/methylmalonyl-CoA synthetase